MKTYRTLTFISVILIMVFLFPGISIAEGLRTDFEGTRENVSGIYCGARWFSGMDNSIFDIRNMVNQFDLFTDEDRVRGTIVFTMNSHARIVEPFNQGRMWGTFVIESDAYPPTPNPPSPCPTGTYWHGVAFGRQVPDGSWSMNCYGTGSGEFEGKRIRIKFWNEDLSTFPPVPIVLRPFQMKGCIIE